MCGWDWIGLSMTHPYMWHMMRGLCYMLCLQLGSLYHPQTQMFINKLQSVETKFNTVSNFACKVAQYLCRGRIPMQMSRRGDRATSKVWLIGLGSSVIAGHKNMMFSSQWDNSDCIENQVDIPS